MEEKRGGMTEKVMEIFGFRKLVANFASLLGIRQVRLTLKS